MKAILMTVLLYVINSKCTKPFVTNFISYNIETDETSFSDIVESGELTLPESIYSFAANLNNSLMWNENYNEELKEMLAGIGLKATEEGVVVPFNPEGWVSQQAFDMGYHYFLFTYRGDGNVKFMEVKLSWEVGYECLNLFKEMFEFNRSEL